ncbi:PorP/SprF family type IX secretion system membrane protein [Aquimarina sediminis]|uniref:PorP/SprF family type IX secretion system membrane protein n=1 Tax=Aquimarina sediminis TaxID=2070536 RepID=UPI000CA0064A|nr:type IX secretion system membrane protein PorP/SprF [Aquimarina sediminis]
MTEKRNNRRYIVLVTIALCVMISNKSYGQEFFAPIQNQYIADNPYLISSAYAGIGNCWQVRASGFEQWVNIPESPSTQSLSVDGRITDRSGVGGTLFNDKNGETSQKGIQLSFAHHLTLSGDEQYLSFGLSYKYTQFTISSNGFTNGNPDNPINPGLENIRVTDSNFDIGVLYRLGRFFLNVNAINLLNKKIDDFSATEPTSIRNYYVYSGYTFNGANRDLEIEPSILYQNFIGDGRSTSDFNLKVRKMHRGDYYWAGLSLRTLIDQDFKPLSLSPMIGTKKRNFYIAYGYQVNLNEIYNASTLAGSHLITLGIDFSCRKSKCGCTY